MFYLGQFKKKKGANCYSTHISTVDTPNRLTPTFLDNLPVIYNIFTRDKLLISFGVRNKWPLTSIVTEKQYLAQKSNQQPLGPGVWIRNLLLSLFSKLDGPNCGTCNTRLSEAIIQKKQEHSMRFHTRLSKAIIQLNKSTIYGTILICQEPSY